MIVQTTTPQSMGRCCPMTHMLRSVHFCGAGSLMWDRRRSAFFRCCAALSAVFIAVFPSLPGNARAYRRETISLNTRPRSS